jgi:hypothetical protein
VAEKFPKLIATARRPGEIWRLENGHTLGGVHFFEDCQAGAFEDDGEEPRYCTLHNPMEHPLDKHTLIWRDDRHLFERICNHGIGHPDPSQYDYWVELKGEAYADAESSHGCDGCCITGFNFEGDPAP